MGRIPLRAKDGSVRAYALVDDADFERANSYRWCLLGHGYVGRERRVSETDHQPTWVYLHRQILGLTRGQRPGHVVDHINRNKLDNRRENLRLIPEKLALQNRASIGASRFRGVSRRDGRWLAVVYINRTEQRLGRFDTELEAAQVAEAYRREHMPFAEPDPAIQEALSS